MYLSINEVMPVEYGFVHMRNASKFLGDAPTQQKRYNKTNE
jgi:hypothetical protein